MVKNKNICEDFIQGITTTKTNNLFIEKFVNGISVLYSYGRHFPLGIKLLDNTFLINSDGYSNTTARHKGLLCYALKGVNFKELEKQQHDDIMFFNTTQLKEIIPKGFKNKLEIIQSKI